MLSNTSILFKDVKNFLSNEVNRVFIAVVVVGLIVCFNSIRTEYLFYKLNQQNIVYKQELMDSNKKIINKIHYRYFNLTKSLEEIHKVNINTKNGKLEK